MSTTVEYQTVRQLDVPLLRPEQAAELLAVKPS